MRNKHVSQITSTLSSNKLCSPFISTNLPVDDVAPWFTNCPNDIIEYAGDMYGAVVEWDEPIAEDNVGIEEPIERTHLPGDYFQEGVHHIENVAQDKAGNEAVCEFTITITAGN